MRTLRIALALAMAVALPFMAFAGETGSISGVVKDSQGGVLAGATVKVSGPQLPGGREAVTSGNGAYQFQRLLPGVYKIETSMSGLGSKAKQVRVGVDVDAQVDFALTPSKTEEITVSAEAPAVDLKSTEVNMNYTSEMIRNLPLSRSYAGLFQLIPGVADNRSFGPSAGGSRQDNAYYMDGVNITNPGFGYLSSEINELDIAEFNVKRGAISAEFGRAAGIATNAVSKSGTNEISGAARFEYQAKGLVGDAKDKVLGDKPFEYVNPAVGLGGPLMKNKVFWYASARYFRTTTPDRVNRINEALPDAVTRGNELFGKITATPTQKHLLALSYRHRPSKQTGAVGTGSRASVATKNKNGSEIASGAWSFFPTGRSTFDLKAIYLKEDGESTPVTSLGYLPAPFNINNLAGMGEYTDPNLNNLSIGGAQYSSRVNYTRKEIKATFGQFFDLGKTQHQIKVGGGYQFGQEDFFRLTNGWGQIARITVSGQPVYRARYYFTQPAQLGQGRTLSAFVQDTVTVSSRLTLNLGVLMNKDEYAQDLGDGIGCGTVNTVGGQPGGAAVFESKGSRCTFIRFGLADQVQPRLGFNFNVREGKGDKLYGNWGRYSNMDQQSSGRSLAPRRIFQREARFNATTGALISDLPRASTTGKLIDKDLKPTYNDEILAGYASTIGGAWTADFFFQYRNTKNFIEDVPSVLPDSGPYAAANLPCATFASCQGAEAKRKYTAFTVEMNRGMKNKWSALVSYTYSKFEGNFDLDYSGGAVFNTSSFIQDGPGTNVQEPNRYGPLSQDRPHVFKVFANYVPADKFTLGAYFRVQSGTPWNAKAPDWEGCGCNYLEPAGSNRNKAWANLDLSAQYRLPIGSAKKTRVTVEARVLNALNTQTVLSVFQQKFLDLNTIATAPFFAPYTQPNPLFGTAASYAPPRRILFSALLNF